MSELLFTITVFCHKKISSVAKKYLNAFYLNIRIIIIFLALSLAYIYEYMSNVSTWQLAQILPKKKVRFCTWLKLLT